VISEQSDSSRLFAPTRLCNYWPRGALQEEMRLVATKVTVAIVRNSGLDT
jgi:hypothetical protein